MQMRKTRLYTDVRSLRFLDDHLGHGDILAGGGQDGNILFWNTTHPRRPYLHSWNTSCGPIHTILPTFDNSDIFLGGVKQCELWDIQSNCFIRKFDGHDINDHLCSSDRCSGIFAAAVSCAGSTYQPCSSQMNRRSTYLNITYFFMYCFLPFRLLFVVWFVNMSISSAPCLQQGSLGSSRLLLWHESTRDPIFSMACSEDNSDHARSISFADDTNPYYIHITTRSRSMLCDLRMHKSYVDVLGVGPYQSYSRRSLQHDIMSVAIIQIPNIVAGVGTNHGMDLEQGMFLAPIQAVSPMKPTFLTRRPDVMTVYNVASSTELFQLHSHVQLEDDLAHTEHSASLSFLSEQASDTTPAITPASRFSSSAATFLDGRIVLVGTSSGTTCKNKS